jgi:hypothetical protein
MAACRRWYAYTHIRIRIARTAACPAASIARTAACRRCADGGHARTAASAQTAVTHGVLDAFDIWLSSEESSFVSGRMRKACEGTPDIRTLRPQQSRHIARTAAAKQRTARPEGGRGGWGAEGGQHSTARPCADTLTRVHHLPCPCIRWGHEGGASALAGGARRHLVLRLAASVGDELAVDVAHARRHRVRVRRRHILQVCDHLGHVVRRCDRAAPKLGPLRRERSILDHGGARGALARRVRRERVGAAARRTTPNVVPAELSPVAREVVCALYVE